LSGLHVDDLFTLITCSPKKMKLLGPPIATVVFLLLSSFVPSEAQKKVGEDCTPSNEHDLSGIIQAREEIRRKNYGPDRNHDRDVDGFEVEAENIKEEVRTIWTQGDCEDGLVCLPEDFWTPSKAHPSAFHHAAMKSEHMPGVVQASRSEPRLHFRYVMNKGGKCRHPEIGTEGHNCLPKHGMETYAIGEALPLPVGGPEGSNVPKTMVARCANGTKCAKDAEGNEKCTPVEKVCCRDKTFLKVSQNNCMFAGFHVQGFADYECKQRNAVRAKDTPECCPTNRDQPCPKSCIA
jgi:hypothetical protein